VFIQTNTNIAMRHCPYCKRRTTNYCYDDMMMMQLAMCGVDRTACSMSHYNNSPNFAFAGPSITHILLPVTRFLERTPKM